VVSLSTVQQSRQTLTTELQAGALGTLFQRKQESPVLHRRSKSSFGEDASMDLELEAPASPARRLIDAFRMAGSPRSPKQQQTRRRADSLLNSPSSKRRLSAQVQVAEEEKPGEFSFKCLHAVLTSTHSLCYISRHLDGRYSRIDRLSGV
jgi:hypothetical protein